MVEVQSVFSTPTDKFADYYLKIAETVATRSSCLKKKYGAVIVRENEIISTGFNGPPRGEPHCTVCTKKSGNKDMDEYCSCPAVHAEQNAIISPSRHDMLGSTLYLACLDKDGNSVPAYPCEICLRLIKNAGINAVVNSQGNIYYRVNNILEKIDENFTEEN